MSAVERHELILRVPNLSPANADRLAVTLERIARLSGGTLSRIRREHHADHALHIGREKIV